MSARQQRTIDELVAVNEALLRKLGQEVELSNLLAKKLEEEVERCDSLGTALADQEKQRDQYQRWWHDERKKLADSLDDRKRYESDRDSARDELQRAKWTLLGVERERDAARIYAETMRSQAYPVGPRFPWDYETADRVGTDRILMNRY